MPSISYTLTTPAQIRASFWKANPDLVCRRSARGRRILPQNQQPTDTRCAFVDYVDNLQRDGAISERLAERVTL